MLTLHLPLTASSADGTSACGIDHSILKRYGSPADPAGKREFYLVGTHSRRKNARGYVRPQELVRPPFHHGNDRWFIVQATITPDH